MIDFALVLQSLFPKTEVIYKFLPIYKVVFDIASCTRLYAQHFWTSTVAIFYLDGLALKGRSGLIAHFCVACWARERKARVGQRNHEWPNRRCHLNCPQGPSRAGGSVRTTQAGAKHRFLHFTTWPVPEMLIHQIRMDRFSAYLRAQSVAIFSKNLLMLVSVLISPAGPLKYGTI